MKNWKTSLAGIAAVITVIANVAVMLLDGNPATNPDWSLVIPAVLGGLGLTAARDNTPSVPK